MKSSHLFCICCTLVLITCMLLFVLAKPDFEAKSVLTMIGIFAGWGIILSIAAAAEEEK